MKYYKESKVLSTGKVATVFWCKDIDAPDYTTIGFRIGKSISENKKWWNGTRVATTTGDGSIEGLLFAAEVVRRLQKTEKGITVCWLDERRHRVYKWLYRYGFIDGRYKCDGDLCLYWTKP